MEENLSRLPATRKESVDRHPEKKLSATAAARGERGKRSRSWNGKGGDPNL